MKNKALKKESFRSGSFIEGKYYFMDTPDKLKFANSDKLQKIQNRNKKRKRK